MSDWVYTVEWGHPSSVISSNIIWFALGAPWSFSDEVLPNFWTNKIQNHLHTVLQCNHRFHPLLSLWTAAPLQSFLLSLLIVRHTHAQTPRLALTARPMAYTLFHTSVPTSGTVSPKTWGYSLSSFKIKLKTFLTDISPNNISVRQHCPSPLSVCTMCVCRYMCVCVYFAHV